MGRGKLSKLKDNETCIARLEMQMIQEEKKKEKQGRHIKVKEERSLDIQTEILSRLKIMEMLANSKDLFSFDFDKLQEVWTSYTDNEFALERWWVGQLWHFFEHWVWLVVVHLLACARC